MRRFLIISLTALAALAVLATAQAAVRSAQKKPDPTAKKVAICHRTSSETKPYVRIKVSKRAALQGHRRHAADIIPAPADGCPTTVLSASEGGTALAATLAGAVEVPGPGVTLPASAAHIHAGAAGIAGSVVVTLTAPDGSGTSSGCVKVARPLVDAILANPAGYYVNVHTTDFPDGAIRGQLAI
jgi:CHRD domain-containing protein